MPHRKTVHSSFPCLFTTTSSKKKRDQTYKWHVVACTPPGFNQAWSNIKLHSPVSNCTHSWIPATWTHLIFFIELHKSPRNCFYLKVKEGDKRFWIRPFIWMRSKGWWGRRPIPPHWVEISSVVSVWSCRQANKQTHMGWKPEPPWQR